MIGLLLCTMTYTPAMCQHSCVTLAHLIQLLQHRSKIRNGEPKGLSALAVPAGLQGGVHKDSKLRCEGVHPDLHACQAEDSNPSMQWLQCPRQRWQELSAHKKACFHQPGYVAVVGSVLTR